MSDTTLEQSFTLIKSMPKHIVEQMTDNAIKKIGGDLIRIALETNNHKLAFSVDMEDIANDAWTETGFRRISCKTMAIETVPIELEHYEDMSLSKLSTSAIEEIWKRIKRKFSKLRLR